jgi:serine/threonine-protein kinase SIK3
MASLQDAYSPVKSKMKLLRVGLYQLQKTIGKGNFAIVKLGTHMITGTEVHSVLQERTSSR